MIRAYKRFTGGIRWFIAEGADANLPPALLDNPITFLRKHRTGRLIKDSLVRTALVIPGPMGDLFIKRYKIRGITEVLKYLVFPSKAQREWKMARLALHRGISTPFPLAMAERRQRGMLREAFLVTKAIVPSRPLIELIPEGKEEILLSRAARLIREAHASGFFHQDLHAGNILVGNEKKQLYVIDLHRSRFVRSLSKRKRLWNIAQFFYSLKDWLSPEDKEAFLRLYDKDKYTFPDGFTEGLQEIGRFEERLYRRHMKSRTKRCLKNSGGFFVVKEDGWRIWARRGWKPEALLSAIKRHREIMAGGKDDLVKDDRRTAITLFDFMQRRICIKEYRYKGGLRRFKEIVRRSKARKGWLRGNGLVVRGFTGITPLALLERRRWRLPQGAFLIMETPSGYLDFRKYIQQTFGNSRRHVDKKKAFIKELAAFMAKLYHLKIAHRDFKISNILVKEDGNRWSFALTDWEDIGLDEEISGKRLIKELVQMNTSIPLFIGIKDRLTFLKAYFSLLGRFNARAVSREVVKDSERRGWVAFS